MTKEEKISFEEALKSLEEIVDELNNGEPDLEKAISAYERGVKVIGATAHYVTPELDEGPIIVQEVRPITHETTAEQMVHLGHDIETTALCQAVRLHCEDRVQINGKRTVIL